MTFLDNLIFYFLFTLYAVCISIFDCQTLAIYFVQVQSYNMIQIVARLFWSFICYQYYLFQINSSCYAKGRICENASDR